MVRMYLPAVIAISMALNHSGHMPNEGLQSSMVFHNKRFIEPAEVDARPVDPGLPPPRDAAASA